MFKALRKIVTVQTIKNEMIYLLNITKFVIQMKYLCYRLFSFYGI